MKSTQPFSQLPLKEALLNNLSSLGYETLTPIQAETLPIMLKAKDVIAKAKTGSGKTAAFGLSILNNLNVEHYAIQALILCPTRELADQVSLALRRLARLMHNVKILNLSGGVPLRPQLESLKHSAHIIVGTPGRILKHLEKASLSLTHLKTLVLDEADRMLDMGFIDDMKIIMAACPKVHQTLLFSATYPDEIKKLAKQFMHQPQEVLIETPHTEHDIAQFFYEVKHQTDKLPLLKNLLTHFEPSASLIFCNTKQQTAELAKHLQSAGYSALALNGDMEQMDRDQVVIQFANRSCAILVATDVAARGLDIKEIPIIINYDLAFEADVHIHRIGRTGRAGHQGLAVSLTTPSDGERLCALEETFSHSIPWGQISELTTKKAASILPEMTTLCLEAGKKDKIRPGDILGALTKDAGLPAERIGKIDITPLRSYVAIHRSLAEKALRYLQDGKLKGRKVKAKKL